MPMFSNGSMNVSSASSCWRSFTLGTWNFTSEEILSASQLSVTDILRDKHHSSNRIQAAIKSLLSVMMKI